MIKYEPLYRAHLLIIYLSFLVKNRNIITTKKVQLKVLKQFKHVYLTSFHLKISHDTLGRVTSKLKYGLEMEII
jgi:hypothetical protein